MQNKESSSQAFPLEVLNKKKLSLAAQRNFDRLLKIFEVTKTGPKAEFLPDMISQVYTTHLERLFHKTKAEEV